VLGLKFEGPRSKQCGKPPLPSKRKGVHLTKATAPATLRRGEKEEMVTKKQEEEACNQAQGESSPPSPNIVELARHPLVQELKTHLRGLEVDVGRLQQENELLRVELDQHQDLKKLEGTQNAPQDEANNFNIRHEDPQQLRGGINALLQQMKVLEARYQHLEEKARAKSALYQESTCRLEDLSTQLFDAQQQLAIQAEKLQVYGDQSVRTDDLLQEIHLLRNENVKLNETVAALSSRPFDGLSKELQKKNLWIAQLEEEKRSIEEDRTRFQQDCAAIRRVNDQLRRRVETLTAESKNLANELSRAKTTCEQKAMENEVAQLQLGFYTSPGDYELMSAVGKALKEMKRQQRKEVSDQTQSSSSRSN
jgi:chromosome segregation ATPase